MIHATAIEIHDHVYEFQSFDHIPGCAICLRAAERVSAERSALIDALLEVPVAPPASLLGRRPSRPRFRPSPAGIAAAALVLASLVWLLFQPTGLGTAFPALLSPNDPLDRLIAELRSPSRDRRAAAEAALKAFGEAAAQRLKKENLDPMLARGVPAPDPDDDMIRRKLRSRRVTIDMENVSLTQILNHLQKACEVRFEIDHQSIPNPEAERISFKVQDIIVDGALRLMLQPRQKKHIVQGGMVFVTAGGLPVVVGFPRAPVRIVGASPKARPLTAALSKEDVAERERAETALRKLGFAAEDALWESLDSKDPEVRARAGAVLGALYTPRPATRVPPLEAKLRAAPFHGKPEEADLRSLVGEISRRSGVPLVFDESRCSPSNKAQSANWGPNALDELSALLVSQDLKVVFLDEVGIITAEKAPIGGTRWDGPVWLPYDLTVKFEHGLAGLASSDPTRQNEARDELVRIGAAALEPLLQASRLLEPAAAARCRDAAARIDAWLVDQASGSDLQSLTDAQRRIAGSRITTEFKEMPWADAVAVIAKTVGGKVSVRSVLDRKVSLDLRDVPLIPLLKALTRPYGLDVCFDQETIVVDTAARIRSAVENGP
jgi:hypothetical protein